MSEEEKDQKNSAMTEPERRFLSVEDIVNAKDMAYEDVFVEEWNGWVRIRSLAANEGLDFKKADELGVTLNELIVMLCAVDPQSGKQLFSPQTIGILSRKSMKALIKLKDVAFRLNGLETGTGAKLGKS